MILPYEPIGNYQFCRSCGTPIFGDAVFLRCEQCQKKLDDAVTAITDELSTPEDKGNDQT